MIRRTLTAVAAAGLLSAALLTVAAPAGAAVSCGTTQSDKDGSRYGYSFVTSGTNIRSGPSTSCTVKGLAYPSQRADYYCFVTGGDGYTWTYLRDVSTNVTGYVRDDLLADHGSTVHC